MGLRGAVAVVGAVAVLVSGCSSALTAEPVPAPLAVGALPTPDGRVLAEIYAGVLRGTGSPVRVVPVPADDGDLAALDAGEVSLVPEYTGRLLLRLQPGATAITSDDVSDALNGALPQGLSVSDQGLAQAPDAGNAGDEGGSAPALDVVPLMRSGVLTGAQIKALSVVAGELTTTDLAAMTRSVTSGESSPERVAADWLAAR